jgi:hypothetical protein
MDAISRAAVVTIVMVYNLAWQWRRAQHNTAQEYVGSLAGSVAGQTVRHAIALLGKIWRWL